MKQRTRTIKDLPKWAQALFAEQEKKSVTLFPQFEEPEPLPRPKYGPYQGWRCNAYGKWVRPDEISTYAIHERDTKLYGSKEDALKALRWEMARLYAKDLLHVDKQIQEEEEKKACPKN